MARSKQEQAEAAAEHLPIDKLKPWAGNPRQNKGAIEAVASSLRRFGFGAPILARRQNLEIIAGHTRWEAAKLVGFQLVPVRLLDLDESEAHALALADNKLGELAEWDEEKLTAALEELTANEVELNGLGFDEKELQELLSGEAELNTDTYTSKIKPPIYTPKGERPSLSALFDRTKTDKLLAAIDQAGLADDEARFLRMAAERHTAFNFQQIAEWYCHATPEVQRLMEDSALVVIDLNRAVELGFVKLTKRLGQLADLEGGEDDEG